MAKASKGSKGGSRAGKERIIPPSNKDVRQASRDLPRGSGTAGRVMADRAVAKKQGVKRPKR
jgi:hypothetical protein